MSRYIKDKCLSVGYYNDIGQPFFDLLNRHRRYIHSYFFSVEEAHDRAKNGLAKLDIDEEIDKLARCNTYGIPGNVLFNCYNAGFHDRFEYIIRRLSEVINLTSVTTVDRNMALQIKELFPNIEIHTSVRYIESDWEYLDKMFEIDPTLDFTEKIDDFAGISDVYNLSSTFSLFNTKLQNRCRELGMKIKYLVDCGCILNGYHNFTKFPGCEGLTCHSIPSCKGVCLGVIAKYPFLALTRTYVYKEELQYIDYDILKISSRYIDDVNEVANVLNYWTCDQPTNVVGDIRITSKECYDIFLKYIEERSKCNKDCINCMRCKYYYDQFLEKGEVMNV